jgi:hypothetical protein
LLYSYDGIESFDDLLAAFEEVPSGLPCVLSLISDVQDIIHFTFVNIYSRIISNKSQDSTVDGMIITFTGRCCPHKPPSSLIELASTFDIVIGTYSTTIFAVSAISAKDPHIH